jgi:hypothetical protein
MQQTEGYISSHKTKKNADSPNKERRYVPRQKICFWRAVTVWFTMYQRALNPGHRIFAHTVSNFDDPRRQ